MQEDPMQMEISIALDFVISYLYNKLPRRRVDAFAEELERGIKVKFQGHWYTDKPFKGSAFRCLRVSGEKLDPVVTMAAADSGLNLDEMKEYLPADLTLWIDPGEVTYRIGEKGQMKALYSTRGRETDDVSDDVTHAQSFKPIDDVTAGLRSGLVLSPGSPPPRSQWSSAPNSAAQSPVGPPPRVQVPFVTKPRQHAPLLTVSQFAQTKFGSSKLKSSSKRPSRLSPTELSLLKQRTVATTGYARPQELDLGPPPPPQLPDAHTQQDYLAHQRALWAQHLQQLSPVTGGHMTDLAPQPTNHKPSYLRSMSSPLGLSQPALVMPPYGADLLSTASSTSPASQYVSSSTHSASLGSLTAGQQPYMTSYGGLGLSDALTSPRGYSGLGRPGLSDALTADLGLGLDRSDVTSSLGLTDLLPPTSPPAYDALGVLSRGPPTPHSPPAVSHDYTHSLPGPLDDKKVFLDGLNMTSLPTSCPSLSLQHLLVAN